jgi:preprotein translocase subunit SecG
MFSATGAANFFVKTTRILAIIFAVTSISLSYLTTKKSDSVVDGFIPPAAPTAPAPTAPAPAAPAAENKAPQKSESK